MAVFERAAHRLADLPLQRPRVCVWEGYLLGDGAQGLEPLETPLLGEDESVDLLAQPGLDHLRRPLHPLLALLSGDDVGEDQAGGDRRAASRQHPRIEPDLVAKGVEPFLCKEVVEVDREVQGLDLVDAHGKVVFEEHAVGASGEGDRPPVDLDLRRQRHLGSEAGLLVRQRPLDAAVELLAEPQPRQTAAAEPDYSALAFAGELADAGGDAAVLDVDRKGQSNLRVIGLQRVESVKGPVGWHIVRIAP